MYPKRFLFIVWILVISGCAYADGSSILTGTTRTPTNPTLVKLYLHAPADYEIIGLVNASGNGWTEQESQHLAIDELKKRAAALGANGVLLLSSGDKESATVGGVYGGTVSGEAIHVRQ